MSSSFGSQNKSPHGFILGSPHRVRGELGVLVFSANFFYSTEPEKDIFDVGWLSRDKDEDAPTKEKLTKIGENEGFNPAILSEQIPVRDILSYKNDLYICGRFFFNIDLSRTYSSIARLNEEEGIWEILQGTDLNGAPFNPAQGFDMCVYKKDLIVVGAFASVDGLASTKAVVGWNGEEYFNLSDINDDTGGLLSSFTATTCALFKGDLWISFTMFPNPVIEEFSTIKWDGVQWSTSGIAGGDPLQSQRSRVMLEFQDNLITGNRGFIWQFSETAWTLITGDIVNPNDFFDVGGVLGMTIYKKDLIICGDFNEINGTPFGRVVRWDGTDFTALGSGLTFGTSFGVDRVYDVHVHKGKLYAVGNFVQNGDGDDVRGLAVWNPGDEVWGQAGSNENITENNGFALSTFSGKLDGELEE